MADLIAWIALLALGAVSERILAARTGPTREVSATGRLSDVVVQSATVVAVVGPLLTAAILVRRPDEAVAWSGAVIAGCGCVLRAVAMRRLGRRYRLTPGRVPSHSTVIANGPYAVVRHPGYTGLLLFFGGLALLSGGAMGLLFLLPLVGGVVLRIRLEERLLVEELGHDYLDYAKAVRWKLVPQIL